MSGRNITWRKEFALNFPVEPVPVQVVVEARTGVIPDDEQKELDEFFSKPWDQLDTEKFSAKDPSSLKYLSVPGFCYYLPFLFLTVIESDNFSVGDFLQSVFFDQIEIAGIICPKLSKEQLICTIKAFEHILRLQFGQYIESPLVSGMLKNFRNRLNAQFNNI